MPEIGVQLGHVIERKRAEEALRDARREADAANRAKSDFLANMSREIRTPMNAILGFSQLIQHSPGLDETVGENVEIINRSGRHLLGLINDVLDMSKIEAGRMDLHASSFDLHALIADLATMFRVRTEEKELGLQIEGLEQVPRYIKTDAGKLRQVLVNLPGAAVKFTVAGGIELRLVVNEGGTNERQLIVEVEDTGVGIAEAELTKVFEAFEQIASGQRFGGGTGLGMAISRQCAELMGGALTVRSELGKGAVFRLEIAFDEGESVELHRPVLPEIVRLRRGEPLCRVLVVDDEANGRALLSKLLFPVGFEVYELEYGEECVEAVRIWKPQLVLMDIRMPVMDGHAAIRHIRAASDGEPPVIIAVTASVFEEERDEVLAGGADDFLCKPFEAADLFEMIRRHLGVVYEKQFFAEEKDAEGAETEATPLVPASLSGLDVQLLDQMLDATLCRHRSAQ